MESFSEYWWIALGLVLALSLKGLGVGLLERMAILFAPAFLLGIPFIFLGDATPVWAWAAAYLLLMLLFSIVSATVVLRK